MWYFALYLAFAVWVFIDARKRLNHPIGWPVATAVLGPVVLPVYFAKRNLRSCTKTTHLQINMLGV